MKQFERRSVLHSARRGKGNEMLGHVVQLTYYQTVKQWEFPPSKFVTYTKSDEAWARPLGFGREVTVERVFTIPRAVCVGHENHTYQFRALYSDSVTGVQV